MKSYEGSGHLRKTSKYIYTYIFLSSSNKLLFIIHRHGWSDGCTLELMKIFGCWLLFVVRWWWWCCFRKLMQAVRANGMKKWPAVAGALKGRSGKQCRERWYNHLQPNIKVHTITLTRSILFFFYYY